MSSTTLPIKSTSPRIDKILFEFNTDITDVLLEDRNGQARLRSTICKRCGLDTCLQDHTTSCLTYNPEFIVPQPENLKTLCSAVITHKATQDEGTFLKSDSIHKAESDEDLYL